MATDSAEESGRALEHHPFAYDARATWPVLLGFRHPADAALGCSRSLQDISGPFACHLIMTTLFEYLEPINRVSLIN